MTLTGALLEVLRGLEGASGMKPDVTVKMDGEALRHLKRSFSKELHGAVKYDDRCGASFEFMGVQFESSDRSSAEIALLAAWDFQYHPGMVTDIDRADMRGMGE